ncbi:MAG: hypothetical protein JST26_02115 [Bacteroidetes bacterium]|nr:hypothetical protein [Bacteroidota bacterium]
MKNRLHKCIACLLLVVLVFAVIPRSYIHELTGHIHHVIQKSNSGKTLNEDADTKDCNYSTFDVPVHYTVFHFILNFLPLPSARDLSFSNPDSILLKQRTAADRLRGPPLT